MGFSIYGIGLDSNLPIPGLSFLSESKRTDVQVWFNQMPDWLDEELAHAKIWFRGSSQGEDEEQRVLIFQLANGAYFQLRYPDGTRFLVDRQGTQVWATWVEPLTLEDTATYLLGPVLGFLLRLRGQTCLHASAINVRGQALVLLGPSGAGKSTTAAAFAQLGYSVLAEDVVVIRESENQLLIEPGYPLIRLWPSSVQSLFGSTDAIPVLTPNWDKRGLPLNDGSYRFQAEPLPLAAIYLLARRQSSPESPLIVTPKLKDSLMSLVENTYGSSLLDQSMRASEFAVLGKLVKQVPVRQVTPHTDISQLTVLCQSILDNFTNLTELVDGKMYATS